MMAVVGYARVSTGGQSLDVQVEQLNAAGCEKVFAEKLTGTTMKNRAELARALDWVREGDVFVVTRLDRLARSVVDLHRIVDQLGAKGVGFRVVQQAGIDTTRPEGRLFLTFLAGFAEFENDLRRERQREGIERLKAQGGYKGRPRSVDPNEVRRLRAEGLGPAEIARRLSIARSTVYAALKEKPGG